MKQDNSISSLTKSQGKLYLHSGGSIMLNIIIIIVIFASILSAVVYMSSSSLRQALSSNQSANAWNMAEAGYRFLSTSYMNTNDGTYILPANGTADDDKAYFLQNVVNGRTYVIPNNGSFMLTVRPYWFYNTAATATGINVSVNLPGTAPTGFTMPSSGQIKIGNTLGAGIIGYTNGVFTTSTGIFTCRLASNMTLNKGDNVYLVLNPNVSKTLTPGSTLTLNLVNFSANAFPANNGLIEISPDTNNPLRLYRYDKATVSGSVLTLTNLQHSDKSTFSTAVTTATTVTFKKCLMIQSRGQAGAEQRTLSFSQAILDSVPSTAVTISLNTVSDLNNNFSRSSSISQYEVSTLQTSGGGSATFSIMDSLTTTGTYKCGAFWYSNTSLINTLWSSGYLYLLSYDVQVKPATGNNLTAGTIGLAIRAKNVGTSTETYLGLTFMKYNLANLFFTNGSKAINPGDTLVGATSGAQGIVQGTPEITSGSWTGGNAAGKIRFASVTGTFSNNELLKVNNVNVAKNTPANGGTTYYTAAATDYIPSAIEPHPSDFSPARYNIGPLLLVLWERKSDGTFRWLAFKDISYDDYTKGLQDWNEPDGSCTTNCTESDGQIINDNASIYVRIQEKRVNLGAGLVKVNDINLFYGDNSSRYTMRSADAIPYDIDALRLRYLAGATTFTPVWAPQYISQWDATVDYFSHIESGTPAGSYPQFQWDAVNPNVTDIAVLKICNDGSATCTSSENGTLRLSELVTPDSGTYSQAEIGMIACGQVTTTPYSTAGFAEFAIQTPGSSAVGFIDTTLYW